MRKRLALAALAIVLFCAAGEAAAFDRKETSGATAGRPAKAVPTLKADAIQAQIVGNTISGMEDGKPYFEYVAPEGTIRASDNSGSYTGVWQIQGDQLCLHYDEDDGDDKPWDCRSIALVDDTISWPSDADKDKRIEAKLIAGNPQGL